MKKKSLKKAETEKKGPLKSTFCLPVSSSSPPPLPPRLILLPPMRHTLPNIRLPITRKLDTARSTPTPRPLRPVHPRLAPSGQRPAVLRWKRTPGRKRISSAFPGRRTSQATSLAVAKICAQRPCSLSFRSRRGGGRGFLDVIICRGIALRQFPF
jgi:hypothetical protein